jgi:hypothetical protein
MEVCVANVDDMRNYWLNPIDEPEYYEEEPEYEFPTFRPHEVKDQLLLWWQMGRCATWILNAMNNQYAGWFPNMTDSTVERWKRVILAHDRRLTGGKMLSELGELL